MVCITYEKMKQYLTHVWFATEPDLIELLKTKDKTDLYYFHGLKYSGLPYSVKISSQKSLIKSLEMSENELFSSYGKHLKAYIARSYKEDTKVQILRSSNISEEIIDVCSCLYEQMRLAKGLKKKFNRNLASSYAEEDALIISIAYNSGAPIGFNAYIFDSLHIRTWLTAFAFREGFTDAQVISRAHQQVEWETMKYCLERGIIFYDFGGISDFDKPNGIDSFKMRFAKDGKRVSYDNFLVGKSLFGKASTMIIKFLILLK